MFPSQEQVTEKVSKICVHTPLKMKFHF